MSEYESRFSRAGESVGVWMMISGLLILGPVGFAVLSIFAYAMYVSNMALAVVCVMLLASPLVLTLVWFSLMACGLLAERTAAHKELAPESNST